MKGAAAQKYNTARVETAAIPALAGCTHYCKFAILKGRKYYDYN